MTKAQTTFPYLYVEAREFRDGLTFNERSLEPISFDSLLLHAKDDVDAAQFGAALMDDRRSTLVASRAQGLHLTPTEMHHTGTFLNDYVVKL